MKPALLKLLPGFVLGLAYLWAIYQLYNYMAVQIMAAVGG